MTRSEIERKLEKLYTDLNTVNTSDEETACKIFNCDSAQEIIDILLSEIDTYENLLQHEFTHERNYEKSADKPYICW